MLGIVNRTRSARSTLLYSEEKVLQGRASCLSVENFLKSKEHLSIPEKVDRLQMLATLNNIAEKKIAHIFLTFDHRDQLTDKNIVEMAGRYMNAAGLGRQPYIVYRHHDTWHPHAHIVSTFVDASGKLIKTPLRLLKELKQLTSAWEEEYSLIKNRRVTELELNRGSSLHAQKVEHSHSALKKSISDVLDIVFEGYNYRNLHEYNALLRECNVIADTGNEGTRLNRNRGLVYGVLNENGERVSRGIRASDFYLKPTLLNLEKKFALNASLSERSRQRVETAVAWSLAGKAPAWTQFRDSLSKEGINIVVQEKEKGGAPEIYFIDHQEKAVFSGESLGSQYTLDALQQKLTQQIEQDDATIQRHHLRIHL